MKPIIIIESPNKKDKIKQITGFDCEATIGHFMEVDTIDEKTYATTFDYSVDFRTNTKEATKKRIWKMIEKCKNNTVYIATDPDREGYAIGRLFYNLIKNQAKEIYRAEFHEITENGIKKGLKEAILWANTNHKYYDSFLGRRITDRVVGYILSPFLKRELKQATSAGRVQTPALNLIVKKQKEIAEFDKKPLSEKVYYTIEANANVNSTTLHLKCCDAQGKESAFQSKDEMQKVLDVIKDNKKALVINTESNDSSKAPPKPFTTSKLLKKASKELKLPTDEISKIAQTLFEKGLITYIRTDSEFISQDFLKEMKSFYEPIYKDSYELREYKAGKASQAEAHEAIRITHCHKIEEIDSILTKEDWKINGKDYSANAKKLYTLIFCNTLQSQMKNATYKNTKVLCKIKLQDFVVNIREITNKGFLSLKDDNDDENNEDAVVAEGILKYLSKDSLLEIESIESKEKQKNPPKQYGEADFIEVLEKNGIGRPSTYATYIPTLLKRNYITIQNKTRKLEPTPLGTNVIDFLANHKYKFILDVNFTKNMEEKLDLIKDGKITYQEVIKEVHQKLDFLPFTNNKNNNSKPLCATEKQIAFAKQIAEKLNIKLPAMQKFEHESYYTRTDISNFISKNSEKFYKNK